MGDLQRELRRGTLEMLLLSLLAEAPTYGYELIQRLRERTDGSFEVREGTLYPVLYRLEDAGWIVPEWTSPDSPAGRGGARNVPRKVYRLTAAGHRRRAELAAAWRHFTDDVETLLAGVPAPAPQRDDDDEKETP